MLVKLINPSLCAKDGLILLSLILAIISIVGCMLDQVRQILWIKRVNDGEEIIFVHRLSTIYPFIFKVLLNNWVTSN